MTTNRQSPRLCLHPVLPSFSSEAPHRQNDRVFKLVSAGQNFFPEDVLIISSACFHVNIAAGKTYFRTVNPSAVSRKQFPVPSAASVIEPEQQ